MRSIKVSTPGSVNAITPSSLFPYTQMTPSSTTIPSATSKSQSARVKQARRGAAESPEVSAPTEAPGIDRQKLATSDGAVAAMAGAVSGEAKDRTFQFVIGHASENVREVIRHMCDRQPALHRVARAVIVGMRITGDRRGDDSMQRRQLRGHPDEGVA